MAQARGEPDAASPSQIRAQANALVLRATQAYLTARKGTGFLRTEPAQRWARQALFFLVWSCPAPIAQAAIRDLAGLVPGLMGARAWERPSSGSSSRDSISWPWGSGWASRAGGVMKRSFPAMSATSREAVLAHGRRAVGTCHLGQSPLDGGRLVGGQRLDRADPDHLLGIARELDQPDDRVDVVAILQEGDDGDPLLGLGAEDQAAEAGSAPGSGRGS